MNANARLKVEAAPTVGPFSVSGAIMDGATAPFEGLWMPAKWSKYSSVEFAGSQSTLSVQIVGSNAQDEPVNQYFVALTTNPTDGDTLSLTFKNPLLPAGQKVVSIVAASDTTTTAAAKLAAAVNADTDLQALQIQATTTTATINITFPSFSYQNLSGAAISDPQNIASPSSPMYLNYTSVSGTSTGATTLVTTTGTNGNAVGSAVTALGVTQITGVYRWIKARLNTLTGTGANITSNYQGVG